MSRRLLAAIAAPTLLLTILVPVAGAADGIDRTVEDVPDHIADLKLDQPVNADGGRLDATLRRATGKQQVIIRLTGPAVAETTAVTSAGKKKAKQDAESEQAGFLSRAFAIAPEARLIAQVQTVLNAVFLEVDAGSLEALAADAAVTAIRPVGDYEIDLSETVPYIGASAVQAAGYDGTGVSVAVLDGGIDYTHAAFGGSGNPEDHAANDPNIIEPGTFPTARVVGGFDFVGSAWPLGPEVPDPDPLDAGPAGGHGTHVADIIGGIDGVAPGVDLYAVKVCSSVTTSCSGIALIQGMDFAVDPDGDGNPSDAVDVINMSLGALYGQPFDDDLSAAVDNASALGILTVASAGNSADKPFVSGSPSATSTALSVAQTQVPSASLQMITVDGPGYPTVFQSWSDALGDIISAPVQYGDGIGGVLNGCSEGSDVNDVDPGSEPFPPGTLSGKIVLVDRGACNFSVKIFNVQRGGGLAGIIGLIAPGAPFDGAFGAGGPYTIPGYMISQDDSNAIKAAIGGGPGIGTIDPKNQLPLVRQVVGSSSRGPNLQSFIVKPEIGAPGASVSAEYGTGTGTTPFGGTSGAAPMVAGSAALLLQSEPGLSPAEVKARLVGTADSDIDTDPFIGAAPITRIGGGEVRVDNAVNTRLAAWDDDSLLPTLSFGHIDVADDKVKVKRKVRVQNYGSTDMTLAITPTFRYADDEASGAVEVKIKGTQNLKVKPDKSKIFEVELTIHGGLLPGNPINSGSGGASGALLNLAEVDGYVYLDDGNGNSIHIPWHVLPRRAAELTTDKAGLAFGNGTDEVRLDNKGVGVAQNDSYSLLDVSPNLPEGMRGKQSPIPDLRAVGINTFPVPAGFCSGVPSFIWAFAINTWERQAHAVAAPAYYSVFLDIDRDSIYDYEVFNFDLSLSGGLSDGRNVTWAADLSAETASAFFFTEHSTVTGNTVLYVCGEQVGLTGTDMLATNVDATFVAWDWYFSGTATDVMGPYTITPLGERYFGIPVDVAGGDKDEMTVVDFGPFPGNTPELGILLVTNGDRGAGARGGATHDTEALIIPIRGARQYVKDILKS